MAFGQSPGPPASGRQMRDLMELLEAAGHADFRDARGPMGFSQRQASGKFTGPEADEFIERLESEVHGDGPPVGSRPPSTAKAPAAKAKPPSKRTTVLATVPSEELAAELQRRGWIVAEP